jgi:hypothetical protein
MSKSCIDPNLPQVKQFVKKMQPTFSSFLNDTQIVGLLNNWLDDNQTSSFPTAEELIAFYYKKTESVPDIENILDILQSLYFEWIMDFSESPVITRKIINEYSADVLEALPRFLRDEGMNYIADNFKEYIQLLNATRFQHLSVPIIDEFDEDSNSKDKIGEFSSNMVDLMARGSDEVQYLFASLKSDEMIYGLAKPINPNYVWGVVSNLLANTVNYPEAIQILQANSYKYPFINQILDRLGVNGNDIAYSSLQDSFAESFNKANYDITVAQVGEKQSYSEVDMKTKNSLINQFKSNFRTSKYAKKLSGKTVVDYEAIKDMLVDKPTSQQSLALLNAMGIPLTELPSYLEKPAEYIMAFVKKHPNIEWLDEGFGRDTERGNLDKILSYLVSKEKEVIRTSVRNAEGETINTNANHNYFSRLFNGLKQIPKRNSFQNMLVSVLKPNITSGLKERNGNESKNFNKLTLGEIYLTKINNMFSSEPSINIPVTSDKTLVRSLKFTKPLSGNQEEYYNGYMAYTAIGPKLYTRLFEAYQRDLVSNFHPDWKYGAENPIDFWHGRGEVEGVLGIVDSPLSKEEFKTAFQKWLAFQQGELKKSLVSSGAIVMENGNPIPKFVMPRISEPNFITKLNTTLDLINFNEFLFGVEITQEMYGSMVGVKPDNFFKRNAGGVAEGRQVRVDAARDTIVQNDRSNLPIPMNYPVNKLRVMIHAETMASSNDEDLKEFHPGYRDDAINVDDAQGSMPLEIYREILNRASQWSDAQEQAFQKLVKGQKLGKEYKSIFPPIKPVGYSLVTVKGKNGIEYKVPVYIKTSVYPIFKSDVVGTLNEDKYNLMREKGVGLIIPKSGIKMANPKKLRDLFKDGTIDFNESALIDFPMEDFRIQLDINQKTTSRQLQGTQQRKLVYMDLFENGEATDPQYKQWLDENIETLKEISEIEEKKLNDKAGIVNGEITNYKKLVDMLNEELLARNLPVNIIEAIKTIIDEGGNLLHPIDGMPSRQKLMNLLNSIVTNKLIKLYTHGSALVQVSQHGWELKPGSTVDTKTSIDFVSDAHKQEYIDNNGLKFLSLGKNTGAAQIILPAKYKEFVRKGEDGKYIIDDKRCLINIGYRIPTQGHNSMLHLEVVGFLPEHFDQMIIMPREITTQGGSDFDVDKMNLFIPNVREVDGKLVFVDESIDGDALWKASYKSGDEAGDKLLTAIFNDVSSIEEEPEEIASREDFLQKLRLEVLQNKLITQSLRILEDPKVREQLLTPNSADTLKTEAAELTKELTKRKLPTLKIVPTWKNMLSSRTLSEIANQMSAAKALVGIFAQQVTNHVLAQQVGLHFKSGRPLFFDHNTVNINGQELISLSGVKSKDGSYVISNMLGNEYLTAAVDAAKEDYLSELGVTLATGDVTAAFTRVGGNNKYLRYWIKNPIVQEYLKEVELNKSLIVKGKEAKSKKNILQNIAKKYKTKLEYFVDKYDNNPEEAAKMLADRSKRTISIDNVKALALRDKTNDEMSIDLLNDFLYFEDMANVIRQNIANTSFDVKGPGKDIVETKLQQLSYENFIKGMANNKGYTLATIVNNEQAPYENLILNTVLDVFYQKSFTFVQSIYKDLVLLQKNDFITSIVDNLVVPSEYVTKKATPEEATLIYGSIINYIIQQNNPIKNSLFYGDNTIAKRIQKIQTDPTNVLYNNYIIQSIQAEESGKTDVPSLIGFKDKNINSLEANFITKSFGEIKEMNKELYDDMIFASLYQSGVVQSPLSYYSLIPYNDILPIINKALSQQSEIIGNPKQVSIAITEILSNIGDKLDNIQKVFLKSSDISGNLNGTVTIVSEKSKEKEFVRLSVTMPDGTSKVGLYEKYYGDKYKFVPSKNYRTLFYNLSSEQEIENEEEDFIENVDDVETTLAKEEMNETQNQINTQRDNNLRELEQIDLLQFPENIVELNNKNRTEQVFKFGIKNFGTVEVAIPSNKKEAPNVHWILKTNQMQKQPGVALNAYKELNNYLQSLGFLPLKSDFRNISKGALNIWKTLVKLNLATEIGKTKLGKPIFQFIQNNQLTWDSLSEDNKLSMTKAGISSEEFNNMTEKEKEMTIDCYGLKK